MVLALDASLSMLAQDERPSRLEKMKEEVRRLRALSPGDRMGVLAFAGRSYVLSPLTIDEGRSTCFSTTSTRPWSDKPEARWHELFVRASTC